MKRRITTHLYIMILLALFSCSTAANKEDKIHVEWQPGINAPRPYPCQVAGGGFYGPDEGDFCPIATGGVRFGDWGDGGLEMSTGHFVPNRLNFVWFSFAEDKFFRGKFDLPYETMQKLFKEGYIEENGRRTEYKWIIVNTYPEGGVAIWMETHGGRCVEIGHFKGEEVDYDWQRLFPQKMETPRERINEIAINTSKGASEYIAEHGINPEPYKTVYRRRYDYTFELEGISLETTEFIVASFFNGEKDTMFGEGLKNNYFKTKAVPKYMYYRWEEEGTILFGEINFREKDVIEAFKKMHELHPNDAYVLSLQANYQKGILLTSLRNVPTDSEKEPTILQLKSKGDIGISAVNKNK